MLLDAMYLSCFFSDTSVLKCKLVTCVQISSEDLLKSQLEALFLLAWVPCLYPFFSLLWTCLRDLILPVPVLFLLMAFTDQLYLLFLVPPPRDAHFLFCKWKFDLPLTLLIAWEWVCFLPAAGVPLVCIGRSKSVWLYLPYLCLKNIDNKYKSLILVLKQLIIKNSKCILGFFYPIQSFLWLIEHFVVLVYYGVLLFIVVLKEWVLFLGKRLVTLILFFFLLLVLFICLPNLLKFLLNALENWHLWWVLRLEITLFTLVMILVRLLLNLRIVYSCVHLDITCIVWNELLLLLVILWLYILDCWVSLLFCEADYILFFFFFLKINFIIGSANNTLHFLVIQPYVIVYIC